MRGVEEDEDDGEGYAHARKRIQVSEAFFSADYGNNTTAMDGF